MTTDIQDQSNWSFPCSNYYFYDTIYSVWIKGNA